jgi:predicted XRE-type DNA-binding protein
LISGTEQARKTMLKNNIEVDVKTRCIEEKISQQQLADDIGTSGTYVSRLIKHQEKIINKTFIAMMERLGYDVELKYIKRNNK